MSPSLCGLRTPSHFCQKLLQNPLISPHFRRNDSAPAAPRASQIHPGHARNGLKLPKFCTKLPFSALCSLLPAPWQESFLVVLKKKSRAPRKKALFAGCGLRHLPPFQETGKGTATLCRYGFASTLQAWIETGRRTPRSAPTIPLRWWERPSG